MAGRAVDKAGDRSRPSFPRWGPDMASRALDDYASIRERMDELRREKHGEPWVKGHVCGAVSGNRSYQSDACPSCGANPWLKGHVCGA